MRFRVLYSKEPERENKNEKNKQVKALARSQRSGNSACVYDYYEFNSTSQMFIGLGEREKWCKQTKGWRQIKEQMHILILMLMLINQDNLWPSIVYVEKLLHASIFAFERKERKGKEKKHRHYICHGHVNGCRYVYVIEQVPHCRKRRSAPVRHLSP